MRLIIELEEMRFYAYHGVMEQEQKVGNTFVVNLELEFNQYISLKQDELEQTINYAEVYTLVKREMDKPSQLLEHVVGRIASALFRAFTLIEGLNIKLSKQKPPFSADIRSASVRLELRRGEL